MTNSLKELKELHTVRELAVHKGQILALYLLGTLPKVQTSGLVFFFKGVFHIW